MFPLPPRLPETCQQGPRGFSPPWLLASWLYPPTPTPPCVRSEASGGRLGDVVGCLVRMAVKLLKCVIAQPPLTP